jgi:hypothetical protein
MYNIGDASGNLPNPAEFPAVVDARLFDPGLTVR